MSYILIRTLNKFIIEFLNYYQKNNQKNGFQKQSSQQLLLHELLQLLLLLHELLQLLLLLLLLQLFEQFEQP